jgi:hypothetical protein
MHVVKVDDSKRVRLPDTKPGACLHYSRCQDGTIFLLPVKEAEKPESHEELLRSVVRVWDRQLRDYNINPGAVTIIGKQHVPSEFMPLLRLIEKIRERLPEPAGELGA